MPWAFLPHGLVALPCPPLHFDGSCSSLIRPTKQASRKRPRIIVPVARASFQQPAIHLYIIPWKSFHKSRHQHDRTIRRGERPSYLSSTIVTLRRRRKGGRQAFSPSRHPCDHLAPQFVHTQATSILAIRLLWHLRSHILHPITSIACLVAVSLFLYSIHPSYYPPQLSFPKCRISPVFLTCYDHLKLLHCD